MVTAWEFSEALAGVSLYTFQTVVLGFCSTNKIFQAKFFSQTFLPLAYYLLLYQSSRNFPNADHSPVVLVNESHSIVIPSKTNQWIFCGNKSNTLSTLILDRVGLIVAIYPIIYLMEQTVFVKLCQKVTLFAVKMKIICAVQIGKGRKHQTVD